jgi:exopolysaccharide biosynthesis polyprenyl glycosylphosphotransferase
MQTASRTRDAPNQHEARRRARVRDSVGDISPVWEVLPQGHAEVGPRHAVLVRDARLRRALACSDLIATFLSLYLVIHLIDPQRVYMRATDLLTVPFVLLTSKVIGLYDRDQNLMRKTTIDEAPSIFYLAVIYALGVWLCEKVLFKNYLFRPQVLALVLLTFLLVMLGRLIVRRFAVMVTPCERCIVIGNAVEAARLAAKLNASSSVNACVIGRISLLQPFEQDQQLPPGEVPVLGEYAQLGRVVSEHKVERVIIAPRNDGQEQILDAIRLVKALGVKVSVVPRLLEVVGSSSTVDEIDGVWILGVRQFGLQRSSVLLKRAVDLIVTSTALILLGPLFVILMIAIKLDSRGPVFFKQPRIGQRGESFWMLKFRSMVQDAEARKAELRALNEAEGGLFKIDRDPRITRVGRLIRRTSLDELPQLINVLRGDMALVGPRPLVPDEDALIEGWQRRRLAVKPGMTGLWQIFGSARIPMHEMVKIDYIYGANWSLWLDLRILLRTVPYVLGRRGQ